MGNIVTGKGASLEVRLGQKSGLNANLEGSNTDLMTPQNGLCLFCTTALLRSPVTNWTWHIAYFSEFSIRNYLMTGPIQHTHPGSSRSTQALPQRGMWKSEGGPTHSPLVTCRVSTSHHPGHQFTRTLCVPYLGCMVRKVSSMISAKVSIVRAVTRYDNV